MTAPTTVYTDGACSGNPGPGGWAWAEPGGAFSSGYAIQTTNQRMELVAAYEAVTAHTGPVEIVTDSTYVMNCFVKSWYVKWLKSGWKNSQKQPVANQDLWKPFVELYLARPGEITFRWVKGHSGDAMNDLVDRLAVQACADQQARSGDKPPPEESLGSPDEPRRRSSGSGSTKPSAVDGRVPSGRRLVVFGHRAAELGGYDPDNPTAKELRRQLADIIAAKAVLHPDLVLLTGLRLGAEMVAGEAALACGVPFAAILPYPEPERVWSTDSQERFRELLTGAASTVILEQKAPKTKVDAGKALARRDGWLAKNASEALLVWDGLDKPLGELNRRLSRHLDEADIWVLDPPKM